MRRLRFSIAAWLGACMLTLGAHAATSPAPESSKSVEKLSNSEKIEIATKSIDQMKSVLAMALERLKTAGDERDMVRVNCVNDRLATIKGLLKISEQADISLREAAARKDEELINHEFTKISIARARVENLRVEVEACVGEAAAYTGETMVELSIDDDIRSDDPTAEDAVVPFIDAIEPPDRAPPLTPAS